METKEKTIEILNKISKETGYNLDFEYVDIRLIKKTFYIKGRKYSMKPENQKLYDEYMNEQLKILTGHFQRIMLRILNKGTELQNETN